MVRYAARLMYTLVVENVSGLEIAFGGSEV
jgi:hypothetical protein